MREIMRRIGNIGLVPVVVLDKACDAVPTARALLAGGVDVMEITMRTEAALDAMKAVKKEVPQMLLGAGTVISREMAKSAVAAGSEFIVAPGLNPEVVKCCLDMNIPVIPGCVTPTEIEQALSLGLNILKFFPAGMYGGVNGCKNLYGPYRMVKFIPTGGVSLENLEEFADKSFIHAIGGSWMCRQSDISKGNFDVITAACKKSVNILVGFDIDNPASTEETANFERADYHLSLAGYEMKDDTYVHNEAGKSVKLS